MLISSYDVLSYNLKIKKEKFQQDKHMKKETEMHLTDSCETEEVEYRRVSPKKIAKYRKQFLARALFRFEKGSYKNESTQATRVEEPPSPVPRPQ